jgi:hypothetical protein
VVTDTLSLLVDPVATAVFERDDDLRMERCRALE